MRISDWSSDVCSSDLLGDDADDQAGDDRNDDTHDSPNRSVLQERDPGTVVPPVPCRSDGIASCAPRRPCQYRSSAPPLAGAPVTRAAPTVRPVCAPPVSRNVSSRPVSLRIGGPSWPTVTESLV